MDPDAPQTPEGKIPDAQVPESQKPDGQTPDASEAGASEDRALELSQGLARFQAIEEKVEAACIRSGRDQPSVVVLGACKRQPLVKLEAAHAAGLRTFAENQVQSGENNRPQMPGDTSWHLIGPLQSNKVKLAVATFDTFHAVDRLKIARALDRHAGERPTEGQPQPLDCFLEVNLGAEESKHGFPAEALPEAAELMAGLPNLRLVGLMAIPPQSETEAEARRWFQRLKALLPQIAAGASDPPNQLSMGMSADFEIAIEEGATHVRIGTALFGSRD